MRNGEPGARRLTFAGTSDRGAAHSAEDVGVAVYDRQGRPLYLSARFCGLVGSSRDDLLAGASPFRQWVGPPVPFPGSGSDAGEPPGIEGAARLCSGAFWYPDGGGTPVNLAVMPLSPEGADSGMVLFEVRVAGADAGWRSADLESLAPAAASPRPAAASDGCELLAGATAHEFRNVLAVIRLAVGQAMALPSVPPELMFLLERIDDSSERGAAIVGSILRLGETQRTALPVSDVDAHIRSLAFVLAETAGGSVRVQYDLGAGGQPVSFEPAGLDSVLINLVSNARKAMPAGGNIVISSRAAADADALRAPGPGFVEVRLSDEGIGMPPEVLVRAFDPLFTTGGDAGGSGLGLSIARELVQAMGGELLIESAQGRGTTVVLRLRAAAPAPAPAPAPARTRVLVVEDDGGLRELAELVLAAEGYEVTTADDARQALEHLERSAFDLMFSDVMMPGGMDGTELAELAAQRWPRMRTLLSSGHMEHAVSGAASWQMLPKPYEPATLVREVARVLKAGDAADL